MGSSSTDQHLQVTRIQDLPEDVLLNILHKLNLTEVANFCLVSEQWNRISFSLENIMINMEKGCSTECNEAFIKWVTRFLRYHCKERSKLALPVSLNSFQILLCFTRHNSTDIDDWISMAISIGVKLLYIRPMCELHFPRPARPDDEKYIFPWRKLINLPIALESLNLRTCIFGCGLTSKWTSLRFLELAYTTITEDDMDKINLCFPNIWRIALGYCKVPAKLTFRSGSLTYLMVWFCTHLRDIDLLGAKALRNFNYRGRCIDPDLKNCPMLTELRIGFKDVHGEEYVFQNIHRDAVRSLSIFKERESPRASPLHRRMNSFLQLTKLGLFNHPTRGISIQIMTEILKACPALESLLMVPPCSMNAANLMESPTYRHKCLKFIEISGFCGSKNNVEMTKFLIQITEELHHLTVRSKIEDVEYKNPGHTAEWHGEQDPEAIKQILLGFVKSDRLTFRCTQKIVQPGMVNKYRMLLKALCFRCD